MKVIGDLKRYSIDNAAYTENKYKLSVNGGDGGRAFYRAEEIASTAQHQ